MSNSVNLSLDVTKTGIQNPLIKVRQGDGGFETLRTTVTANGEPMDLQGWTITFMGTTAGNHKIVDSNVTVVEAPNGIFDYTPSKAWGMDIGDFKIAYFKFVKGDGSASSANFRVSVIEAVDLTQEEAQHYISVVDAEIAEAREHLENSLADVSSSVAVTSSAVSSMAVFASSATSSAVSQANSAASNASSVASSAVSSVSSVASGAVSAVNAASNVYVKKSNVLPAEARDFNYLATHMQTYQGFWYNRSESVANAPTDNWTYSVIEIIAGNSETTGLIRTMRFGTNAVYSANINGGSVQRWALIADDAQLVHKTGNETITGDKTFTGNVNFSGGVTGGQVNLPASGDLNTLTNTGKYYQSSSSNTANWTNRPSNAPNLAFSVDVIGQGDQANQSLVTQVYYVHTTGRMWVRTMWLVNSIRTASQWAELANDENVVHKTGNETIAGDKTFTGTTNMSKLNVSGETTFYTKSINWSTGIMQGNWTLQRIGSWVMAKFDMSATTSTGNTALTLPIGFRPFSAFVRDLEAGNAGIKTDGSVFISTSYSGSNAMTFIFPTNDAWPA